MPTLKRRHVALIEDEFTVTSQALRLAFDYYAGRLTYSQALARLQDWRWSEEDANLFLELIMQLYKEVKR